MECCLFYVVAYKWLFYVIYTIGICLLISGWIKFRFSPLWFLMILTSPLPLFPTFFGLKRQYLRRINAPQTAINIASRQFKASMWFVVVAIVVSFVISVVYFYKAMNLDPITIDAEQWSRSLFIGWIVVIACYIFSLIAIPKIS